MTAPDDRPDARPDARANGGLGPPAYSGGPDAVHLCLTVRGRAHLYGCAWASYGEARGPGPRSGGRRLRRPRRLRARPLGPPGSTGPCGPMGGA